MELMFNELSVDVLADDKYQAIEIMTHFAKTYKRSRDFGFKRIRSDKNVAEITLAVNYTVHNWLTDNSVNKNLKDFMFGSIVTPFISEDRPDVEDAYIKTDYFYKKNDTDKAKCLGLAASYLCELPAISLNTSEEWQRNLLPIILKNRDTEEEHQHQVLNVFEEDCFNKESIREFVENLGKVKLQKSPLSPNEKDIHLAKHHGKKELQILCDKLKNNEYVVAMRSTNWGGNTFIRKIHKNGVIEITIVNSPRRYALLVKTTGRNYRETEAIAKELKERYS